MNTVFFKLAFRNILKNRLNSGINMLGFSVGIAACLFLFLFIRYETGFDQFYPDRERIYRVIGTSHHNDETSTDGAVWFPVAPEIKNEIPGIDDYCRVNEEYPAKFYLDKNLYTIDRFRFADSNFFRFFGFELIAGDPETALNSAEKIVLTRQKARQIFGDANPLGQMLLYDHQWFTVSGIAADPPSNTHLGFDGLGSLRYIEKNDDYWKNWGGGVTLLSYLRLSENVSPQQVEQALPDLLYRRINQNWEGAGWSFSVSLQNIGDVHLSDGTIQYDCSTNRSKKSIYMIAGISLLILLLAIVNYIILYTAQKISKTRDVGILKMHGAGRYGLMIQTYTEVVIISAVSSLSGIVLLLLGLPFLNEHLQTTVSVGKEILPALGFLVLTILLLSAVVTFFSTRRIVSSKAIDVVKSKTVTEGSGNIQGNLLISFQFTVVILLLVSVLVISRQNRFLLNQELGFNKENILFIDADEEFYKNELAGFKEDLKRIAAVHSVCLSSQPIGQGLTANGYTIGTEEGKTIISVLYTDADFLECFDIRLTEGRNFHSNPEQDKNAVLINRQLAKRAGWQEPLDKELDRNGKLKVIGVVENFNFTSLENAIEPLIIQSNPAWDGWGYAVVNIRFQTADIRGLIKQIEQLWKDRFPETPYQISFLDDALASNYQSLRAQQKIISFFSFLATLIALVGLFGLTVFTTRRRIKEIGIRKVNGARVSEVMVMLNKGFIKWVAIAFVIATPVAYYVMQKWLENFAYKTDLSWWIFALSGVLALGIALLTVSWQSWKAASRNPVEALRYE
jgi:putative ABC transport system permease protein